MIKNQFLKFVLEKKAGVLLNELKDLPHTKIKISSNVEENYDFLDDFFAFTESIEASHEELYQYLKSSSLNLSEILVGRQLSNHNNREIYIEKFTDLIGTNEDFFKDLIKVCLEQHTSIIDEMKEKNLKIFTQLVDIGIDRGFFNSFTEEEKQTENKDYIKILLDKKVFEHNFNTDNLLNLVKKRHFEDRSASFFSMYGEDIYNFLDSLNDENIYQVYKKIYAETDILTSYHESAAKEIILTIVNKLIFSDYNCSGLMKNNTIRQLISNSKDNSTLSGVLIKKDCFKEYLNHIDEKEAQIVLEFKGNKKGILVDTLNSPFFNEFYLDNETVNIFFKKINDASFLEKRYKNELVGKFLLSCDTKKIDYVFYEKNYESIVNCCSLDNEPHSFSKKIDQFSQLMQAINTPLVNKMQNKLKVLIKDDLYKAFKENKDKETIYITAEIINLSHYIGLTKDTSCLDVLNVDQHHPDWKKMNITYPVTMANKKTQYKKENIVSYLLDFAVNYEVVVVNRAVIDWIVDNTPQHFFSITKRSKNLISYYMGSSQLSTLLGAPEDPIYYLLSKILDSAESYEAILKNNKPQLKKIRSLNNESINKKLHYYEVLENVQKKSPNEDKKMNIPKI